MTNEQIDLLFQYTNSEDILVLFSLVDDAKLKTDFEQVYVDGFDENKIDSELYTKIQQYVEMALKNLMKQIEKEGYEYFCEKLRKDPSIGTSLLSYMENKENLTAILNEPTFSFGDMTKCSIITETKDIEYIESCIENNLIQFEDEEYEDVPKWLLPINKSVNFLDMESGDGRNQALFNYILTLQSNDFSVEEARDCIKLINKYVLHDPLEESELETVLRDEAFQKPIFFTKKGSFLFDKFATYIKNNNHIIKINGQLHIYKNGIYVSGQKYIEAEMIKHIPNLNRSKRAEVLTYLDLLVGDNTNLSNAKLIAFKNGIYDIETDEFLDFSPDYVITNKINFDYIPDSYSEITNHVLDKLSCDDEQIRMLLEEVIGYVMYRRNELRKAFILLGDKANGKSTYLDMIKTMLGDENTSALDLKELGDRSKTAELFGKLANIGDDIGDDFIPNPAVFKKLTSGDRLNAERKGQDPFDFNNYAKFLFSANNIPRIKDKSGAVQSRLIIIPFDATFSKEDPDFDPHIKYKLRKSESMEYLIQLGIAGLKRVLENRGFTTSEKVQKELEEYEENNNPILLFFKEEPKIENEPTADVYRKYSEFCLANSFTAMSNIEFSKQVKKRFNFDITNKTIRGKKYRIFIRKEQ